MSSPPLNESCNRVGLFKWPVRLSANSRWPQALVQNRKQLRLRSFVLAAWPSCRGPRQPAANELGGGPVRHVRPTEIERLAGPSAPSSAMPHSEFDLTPHFAACRAALVYASSPQHLPRPPLAWIPMEEERPNENASALPENSGIFALSAPWSLCGSKSYRGVSREVSRSIVYSAFVDQLSFRPGKIGIRRS